MSWVSPSRLARSLNRWGLPRKRFGWVPSARGSLCGPLSGDIQILKLHLLPPRPWVPAWSMAHRLCLRHLCRSRHPLPGVPRSTAQSPNRSRASCAEAKARKHPALWARLQDAARRLRSAGDLDYMRLSIAAKTFFVLGQQRRPATPAELAQLAPRFGWRVAVSEIEEAADYLQKPDLLDPAHA